MSDALSPRSISSANEDRQPLLPRPTQEDDTDDALKSAEENDRDVAGRFARAGQAGTTLKIAAAMYSFLLQGMIASTVGVMLPYLESYYGLADASVSLIFLCAPVGYFVAATVNSPIHSRFGRRGIAVIGPLCRLVFTAVASAHTPFPIFLASLAFGCVGTGLLDGSWSAWAGSMRNVNTVQGVLHGAFSTGASLGPFLAGCIVNVGKRPWYNWYYLLTALTLVEIVIVNVAFRSEDAQRFRAARNEARTEGTIKSDRPSPFNHRVVWICAAFFLAYVGTEASISGWIVTFMRRSRHAEPYLASLSSSFFWISMTMGRLTLGPVADRFGTRAATALLIILALILQVVFAIVPDPVASAVIISLLGYCFGPMFPSGLVMLTRLLPSHLHVGATAFVVFVGSIGAAAIPFAVGALSDSLGIQVFQVVIFAWLFITLGLWLSFPRMPASDEIEEEAHSP